jgi:hypothetical protein
MDTWTRRHTTAIFSPNPLNPFYLFTGLTGGKNMLFDLRDETMLKNMVTHPKDIDTKISSIDGKEPRFPKNDIYYVYPTNPFFDVKNQPKRGNVGGRI